MFTGIIEETGILMSVKGGLSGSRLAVKADRVLEDIQKGDSIAVNGVCLTAYSFDSGCFYADVCGACGAGSSAHMPRMCFVRSDGVYGTVCRNYGFVINNQ